MPSLSLLRTLCREILTHRQCDRISEADLVMDDADKVPTYVRTDLSDIDQFFRLGGLANPLLRPSQAGGLR